MPESFGDFFKGFINSEHKKKPETSKKKELATEQETSHAPKEYEKFWMSLKTENWDDYAKHWTPERRKSYIEEGAEFLLDVEAQGIQTMVFMDRSARPLALMLRMLWKRIYPDKEPPEMRFAVGRRDYDRGDNLYDDQIQKLYRKEDFEGKKVLFIDEEIARGGTLKATSSLFKRVFPDTEVALGALSATERRQSVSSLSVQPPTGSYYHNLFTDDPNARNLAQAIHRAKEHHRQTEVEEEPGKIIAKRQKMPQKDKWTYRLMLVGKHETLDEKSLQFIDEKIQAHEHELTMAKEVTTGEILDLRERQRHKRTEEKIERLKRIREAYEKLTNE